MNLKKFAIGLIVIVTLFTTTACDDGKTTTSSTNQETKTSKESVADDQSSSSKQENNQANVSDKDDVSTTTTEKKSAKQTEYKLVENFKEFGSDIYAEYLTIDIPENSRLGMFTQYGGYIYYAINHFDEKLDSLKYSEVYKYNIESKETKKIITIKDAIFVGEIAATKDYLYIDQICSGKQIVKRYSLDGKEVKIIYETKTGLDEIVFGLGGNVLSWEMFEEKGECKIQIIDEKTGRIITPKLKGEDVFIPGTRIAMVKDDIIIPRKKRYTYAISEYNINTEQEKELFEAKISDLNALKANEKYVGCQLENRNVVEVLDRKGNRVTKIDVRDYYNSCFSFSLIGDYLFISTTSSDILVFDLKNKTYSKLGETFMPDRVKKAAKYPYRYHYTYDTRDNKFIVEPFIGGGRDVAAICLVGVKEKSE